MSSKFEKLILWFLYIDGEKRDEIDTEVLKKEQVYVVVVAVEGMVEEWFVAHIVNVQPLLFLCP